MTDQQRRPVPNFIRTHVSVFRTLLLTLRCLCLFNNAMNIHVLSNVFAFVTHHK